MEASGAPVFNNNPYLRLNGRGVLVGIIDTGIDYLNKEFQREDDTTRIVRIWDQTIQGDKDIYNLKYGTEYTEDQINQAISLQTSGGDPYSIVPSKDDIGHGTRLAGIIGGRGINPDLKGAAPDCQFVIVKLARATKVELDAALIDKTDVPSYSPWSVLLALRYVVSVARALEKPVVVFIPLGSNMGSHTGNGIIEASISNFSTQASTVVVVPTGNQGNTDTHTEGIIESSGDIKDIEIRQINTEIGINPREAFYANKELVDIKDSLNMICGESIMAYPPGIPIISPGEIITYEIINYINLLKDSGAYFTDAQDKKLNKILVVNDTASIS